jgi:VanZ family protein
VSVPPAAGAAAGALLKPLRRPRLWLGLWLLAVGVVVVASLVPPPAMQLPRHGDKIEHLLGYALLAAGAVQLFRPGYRLLAIGMGLVLLGVLLEVAQGALTVTRQADPLDALANALGVGLGLLTVFTPWRDALPRLA